jgi:hypothetical protein
VTFLLPNKGLSSSLPKFLEVTDEQVNGFFKNSERYEKYGRNPS